MSRVPSADRSRRFVNRHLEQAGYLGAVVDGMLEVEGAGEHAPSAIDVTNPARVRRPDVLVAGDVGALAAEGLDLRDRYPGVLMGTRNMVRPLCFLTSRLVRVSRKT